MTGPVVPEYPATVEAVAGRLGVPVGAKGDAERGHIAKVVPAVNAWVATFHDVTGQALGDQVVLGSVMLAARITRRRNTPNGIESFGDLGSTYVARHDPDIERMLGTGPYRALVVG